MAVRRVWQQFSRFNHSVYSAALRGSCCTVLTARFDVNPNKRRLLLLTFDFVERTKFQRKTRSTLLLLMATKSNVAATLLLVWTGL